MLPLRFYLLTTLICNRAYSFTMATAVGARAGFVSGLEVSVSRSQALKEPTNNPLMYLPKASEVGITTI